MNTRGRVGKDTFLVLHEFVIILGPKEALSIPKYSPKCLDQGSEIPMLLVLLE